MNKNDNKTSIYLFLFILRIFFNIISNIQQQTPHLLPIDNIFIEKIRF